MKDLKCVLALLTVMALLFLASGFAEEQGTPELELLPTESMDIPADEALPAEGEDVPSPVTLALDQTSVTLDYSQCVTLTATAGGNTVTWSSSDARVAALSAETGESVVVSGLSAGTATITCTVGEQRQSCEVTVIEPNTLRIANVDYPSTYRMAERGWKLRRGVLASNVDLVTITTVLKDVNGTTIGSAFTYTFGSGVRRYEINGLDHYVPFAKISAAGVYTWTLSATDATGRMVSVSLPIDAVAEGETAIANEPGAQSPVIVATGIALNNARICLQKGEIKYVSATVTPEEALNSGVIWVSDDPSVAVVSPNGEVTGVGIGMATISCRTLGNPSTSASCAVTVQKQPDMEGQLLYGTNTVNALTNDGSWANMHWRAASGGTGVRESIAVTDAPASGIKLGWKLTWEAGLLDIAQDMVPIQAGETYTLSCYARGAGTLRLQMGRGPEYPITTCDVNGSEWQRYEMAYTFGEAKEGSENGATNAYFGCSAGEIEICGMKLERGGTASEWTPAAGEADAQQEGLQILRATNATSVLAQDGQWIRARWRAASGGIGERESIAVTDAPIAGIERGWKLAWENGFVDIAQDNVPIQVGSTYTLSCYARGSGTLRLQVGRGPEYPSTTIEVDGSEWQKYEIVHTFGSVDEGSVSGLTNAYFGCSDGEIEICGMKFELGSVASEWTPAPGEGN